MADTTPPVIPSVHTTTVSASQINISWEMDENDDSVQFELRRDGVLNPIATVYPTSMSGPDRGLKYADKGLKPGQTYSYTVTAFDNAGNSTVSPAVQGMTLWWPEGYDLPAFRVKRETYGLMEGGDWTRGSSVSTLPHTALRYPSSGDIDALYAGEGAASAIMLARPFDYHTVEVMWRWPAQSQWAEVALVRSTFGQPATPRDGETVFRSLRSEFDTDVVDVLLAPPVVYDVLLPPQIPDGKGGFRPGVVPNGHWYYYSLFFRTQIDWVLAMSDGCVIPRNYGHGDHMWNVVPPYYQWVDDNQREGAGHLRQFLNVFGFVMDNTREFVEGLLDLHDIDKTPMALLKGLGANYGLPYESGIGDIRYRGLIANAPRAQHTRGTSVGLQQVIEAVSKYQTVISDSRTIMLYPDDSDFYNSTGNWGGPHPDAVAPILAQESALTSLTWDKIYVARVNKAPYVGRGVMRVYTAKANETADLIIAVGDSRMRNDGDPTIVRTDGLPIDDTHPAPDTVPAVTTEYTDARPLEAGISVVAGLPYGFSIWIQAPEKDFSVQAVLIWIGPSGEPQEVVDVSLGVIATSSGTSWKQYIVQGSAPVAAAGVAEARYMIPAVRIFLRTAHTLTNRSAAIDFSGAMAYQLGDENSAVAIVPPDRYLTMGAPSEKIGKPKEGFEGFIIGSPESARRKGV